MLNLHTFPIVPYPGLAPELAVRSGMGGWDAYALLAPTDRLLPFVLTRPRTVNGSAWVNCAWIENADDPTQRIHTLLPTGETAGNPPPNGLVLTKVFDAARNVDYFIYAGAIIPTLNMVCGTPLRLVLDGDYQSPRFLATERINQCMKAEWWHAGPLSGIPYGTGLRQRLYIDNAALSYSAPREEEVVTKDAATGAERTDFLALWLTKTFETEPLPAYLCQALSGLKAHAHLELDGEAWKPKTVKETVVSKGRQSMNVTVEQQQVVVRRAGAEPVVPALAYDPTRDAPRPYRCGDVTDTAPDWQTFQRTCLEAGDGTNSGYVNLSQRDVNPNSSSFNQTRSQVDPVQDFDLCPLPIVYQSVRIDGYLTRNNCTGGQTGSEEYFAVPAGAYTSTDSQAAANALAQAYYDANAQASANTNGTCTSGPAWAPVYDPETNCFTCQMVSTVNPAIVRDATHLEAGRFRTPYVFYNGQTIPCPDCDV